LDKEFGGDVVGEDDWDKFFDLWFGDCDDWELIEDSINGGRGYGKIVVDKVNKSIKIMVVPCLYSDWDDIKIFGFDYSNGELFREIEEKELEEMLKDKDYFIG
jgi:hypothetical protein